MKNNLNYFKNWTHIFSLSLVTDSRTFNFLLTGNAQKDEMDTYQFLKKATGTLNVKMQYNLIYRYTCLI